MFALRFLSIFSMAYGTAARGIACLLVSRNATTTRDAEQLSLLITTQHSFEQTRLYQRNALTNIQTVTKDRHHNFFIDKLLLFAALAC